MSVQVSMRIRAVWSEHPLFVDIYYSIHCFCKRTMKALISLRLCAGWSGPALSANCLKDLFVRCASYYVSKRQSCLVATHTLVKLFQNSFIYDERSFVVICVLLWCFSDAPMQTEHIFGLWATSELRARMQSCKTTVLLPSFRKSFFFCFFLRFT